MNGVPNNMLGTAGQAVQNNPMFLIQEMMRKFEQEKLASLQAGQERTAQYQQSQEQRATDIEAAGERFATAPKTGAADIALTAASLILPVIGALLPQGRGLRGQRAKAGQQQALTGLGQGLGAVQQYRLGREEVGRERAYKGEMEGIEHLSGLADMIYQGQERQAATQLGAAGTQAQLGMRGLGVAAQYQKTMQPKLEKGLTWGDLKTGRFGELSPGEQKDALYPGLAPSTAGGLTENQREKNRQQDVINRANMHLYSLDPEIKKRAGIDYDIISFASLAEAAQALAKHRKPTGFMGWGEGEAAPDSALYDLMIEYMGQGGGQTGKPPDMTDAEWQEYLQMKGQ